MSTISQTDSTRHILGPPHRRRPPPPSSTPRRTHSHTLNYLPSKFSPALGGMVPRGRGAAAFHADAARMAAEGDGDYNGTDVRRHSLFPPLSALTQRKLRWTRFKSILFLANLVLSLYALALLVFVILTYLRTLPPPPVLVLTAALGRGGVLLNNRGMLAVYTLLLWVSLWADGGAGINQQWSQQLGAQGRLTVQETLGCCGYFSPFVEDGALPPSFLFVFYSSLILFTPLASSPPFPTLQLGKINASHRSPPPATRAPPSRGANPPSARSRRRRS
ncbi:hypothetical protein B0H14DRAFT_3857716 [Mycena olivaceomarginata]|nr:hypothetical protein B0H14DRAFT_3857716 [Mycena olivaceomarginata]